MLACSAAAETALLLPAGPEAHGLFMCPECCVIDSGLFDLGAASIAASGCNHSDLLYYGVCMQMKRVHGFKHVATGYFNVCEGDLVQTKAVNLKSEV